MAFPPTPEQQAAIDAFRAGTDMVIQAGAGAGKSSTLRMIAASAPNRRGLYVSFGKAIVEEAKRSFPPNVMCATAHSIAYQAIGKKYRERLGGSRMPAYLVAQNLGIRDFVHLGSDVNDMMPKTVARIALDTVARFCRTADEEIRPHHVPRQVGYDTPSAYQATQQLVYPYAARIWEDLQRTSGVFPFTHDVYLKLYQLSRPTLNFDFILFDEAQDADPLVTSIISEQSTQRVIVGDSAQEIYCQPAGTRVAVVTGRYSRTKVGAIEQVPIESIQPGDLVASYGEQSRRVRRSGARVTRNEARTYTGDLVTATTISGLSSTYTAGHHCVIRWDRATMSGARIVYLMQRGEQFRIGSTNAVHERQGGRHGLAIRVGQEDADAAWILSIHDAAEEGYAAEHAAQIIFDIPGLTFKAPSGNPATQEEIDRRWAEIGPVRDRAAKALEDHGLSIDDPLWKRGGDLPNFRTSVVATARNLMRGMTMLKFDAAMDVRAGQGVPNSAWQPITVERRFASVRVYSLSVEGDHTYFADGLLTHNSWRGALNAMDKFPGERYTLSKSFRFGHAVAREANRWLDVLDAPLRLTGHDPIPSTIEALTEPRAILCRTNGGAMREVINHIDTRRVALLGGGDQIKRLAYAAQDLKEGKRTDHPELAAFANWDEVREYVAHDSAGSDLAVSVKLIDTYTPRGIIGVVSKLTDEKHADLIVSTAHKAKGCEWPTVKIADDFRAPRIDDDGIQQPVQPEEARLAYVAVTRAQRTLDRGSLAWIDTYEPNRPLALAAA